MSYSSSKQTKKVSRKKEGKTRLEEKENIKTCRMFFIFLWVCPTGITIGAHGIITSSSSELHCVSSHENGHHIDANQYQYI
jgi:hypothetical protein